MKGDTLLLHASCVSIDDAGVLLRGPSGAGKSDLALRLIDGGATLIADDQTELTNDGGVLIASAPPVLLGKLEVRGVGILPVEAAPPTPVLLLIDLAGAEGVERMPENRTEEIGGISLPLYRLDARQAATPAKIRLLVNKLKSETDRQS